MAIKSGDILLDSLYLGEYAGIARCHDTKGIVIAVTQSQALIYWFEREPLWGRSQNEYEWFDLNNEKDVCILEDMKTCYEESDETKGG